MAPPLVPAASAARVPDVDGPGRTAIAARRPAAAIELPAVPEGADLSAATGAPEGKVRVMVELVEPSAAVAYGEALQSRKGFLRAQATGFAVAAGKTQLAVVEAAQARFDAALFRLSVRPRELYRVQKALNGVALEVGLDQMGELRGLPGVKRVIPLYLEYPTNSTSVPFIGAPSVWANTLGLPAGALGTGIRIGIIDTGIDYLHPDFGGPGATAADYTTERTNDRLHDGGDRPTRLLPDGARSWAASTSPGTRTTGSNAPCPTPTRWTATATAARRRDRRRASASTRTAPPSPARTTPTRDLRHLRIGPGAAPKARLYALRVFGCGGGDRPDDRGDRLGDRPERRQATSRTTSTSSTCRSGRLRVGRRLERDRLRQRRAGRRHRRHLRRELG